MEFEPENYYHVYNKSINRELLFRSDENQYFFLRRYNHYLNGLLSTFSYCLMPNHFHLFIKINRDIPSEKVEKGFRNLFISYAKAFNTMYERTGSIFQAKYKAKAIKDDAHFTAVIAYLHLNPVKANLCLHPKDWKFSSYNAILNSAETAIRRQEILDGLAEKKGL
jgi:putative transposase